MSFLIKKSEANNEDLKQEARISLLQYYSSKCTAHGTNILTIVIGFFASIQILNFFTLIDEGILLSILITFFVSLLFHQVVRLITWAILEEAALHIDFPKKIVENLINSLDREVKAFFYGTDGTWKEKCENQRKIKIKTFSFLNKHKILFMLLVGIVCFFLFLFLFKAMMI